MSLMRPSLVSPTTGFTVVGRGRPDSPASRRAWVTSASATRPTQSVLVSAMGVSRQPSSDAWTRPHVLPNPLSTCAAATGLLARTGPSQGRTTVTPVWTSPRLMVAWPTVTPPTSAIESLGPQGSAPTESAPLGLHCACDMRLAYLLVVV